MSFDPTKHLINLKGKDYLQVMHRLAWFRDEHPDGQIETELVHYSDQVAVIRARATYRHPSGEVAMATAYGSETKSDFPDHLEKSECLGLDYQILTRGGWKTYDQIAVGEEVLAYDLDADQTRWTPLQAVTVYHEPKSVVRLSNRHGFDVVMTPRHSWAVVADGERRLVEGHRLRTSQTIILAAPCPEGFLDLDPADAARLGWLVTDGTIWRANGELRPAVYQSKPERIAELEPLLAGVANRWVGEPHERDFGSYTSQCLPQHIWYLERRYVAELLETTGLTGYEGLPGLVTRLAPQARRAMLEAMMAADGSARGYFGKIAKPGVQDAFQILATLEGRAVGSMRGVGTLVVPVQRLKERRVVSVSNLELEEADPQPVWCPTTAYGTWVTRLPNQMVTITGNTKAVGRALAMLGYGTQFATELAMDNPDGTPHVVDSPVARNHAAPYRSRSR